MGRVIHLIKWGLCLALLVFTSFRTVHFLGETLPADQQVIKYLGLAAFDGGILIWLFVGRYHAKGWQRAIAFIMVFVCMAGVCVCTWADTFMVSSQNGLVRLPEGIEETALYGVLGVILFNVVMVVIYDMASPEHIRQWKTETAHDKIEEQTLRQIDQGSVLIAPDIAQQLARQWQAETYQNLMLPIPEELPQLAAPQKKTGFWQKVTGDVSEQTQKS